MAAKQKTREQNTKTILLTEEDVIVRLALADHLRGCGFEVIEAATSQEAKTILQGGPPIAILICDAQLAGAESGFALAQWVRRYRVGVQVILAVSLANKTQAVHELCCSRDESGSDVAALLTRIQAMVTTRRRRQQSQQSASPSTRRRKRI